MANDLSILIPARNEMFLAKTIENILANIEGDTEIIACLDGAWANPGIVDNPKVILLHYSESVGQRVATNQAARLSKAKYIMKCDAHCAFDKGFDVKMMQEMHADWTMVPVMKNLHAFDWVCPEGHRRYQGPSGPCKECGKETVRDILWQAKPSPNSVSYCFDSTPHFQYFGAYPKRPEGQGEITETMSLQGSCWMLTRDKYWELNVCDENFGSWGSQGIEVAVKTWLSGGRVMVNKKTWYAHMFRTQGGDFGFPYPIKASDQEKAKTFARDLFFDNSWDKQIHPLSWLIEKFWPVPGWTDEDLKKLKANTFRFPENAPSTKPVESEPAESTPATVGGIIFAFGDKLEKREVDIYHMPLDPNLTKGIVYYTDNRLKLKIAYAVQRQLKIARADKSIPITCSSIKNMTFGEKSICFPDLEAGPLTTLKLIVNGLENCNSEIVFLCENDVLYHPTHFDFTPPKKNVFYYNQNWWRIRTVDGLTVHWDANQVLGLCGYRDDLINFYKKRVADVEKNGNSKLSRKPGGSSGKLTAAWKSEYPNIDIKHENNFEKYKWSLKDLDNKPVAKSFQTTDDIPGWGKTADLIKHL